MPCQELLRIAKAELQEAASRSGDAAFGRDYHLTAMAGSKRESCVRIVASSGMYSAQLQSGERLRAFGSRPELYEFIWAKFGDAWMTQVSDRTSEQSPNQLRQVDIDPVLLPPPLLLQCAGVTVILAYFSLQLEHTLVPPNRSIGTSDWVALEEQCEVKFCSAHAGRHSALLLQSFRIPPEVPDEDLSFAVSSR